MVVQATIPSQGELNGTIVVAGQDLRQGHGTQIGNAIALQVEFSETRLGVGVGRSCSRRRRENGRQIKPTQKGSVVIPPFIHQTEHLQLVLSMSTSLCAMMMTEQIVAAVVAFLVAAAAAAAAVAVAAVAICFLEMSNRPAWEQTVESHLDLPIPGCLTQTVAPLSIIALSIIARTFSTAG
jgi:hypothetical protein